jgi:hypothetical protein
VTDALGLFTAVSNVQEFVSPSCLDLLVSTVTTRISNCDRLGYEH